MTNRERLERMTDFDFALELGLGRTCPKFKPDESDLYGACRNPDLGCTLCWVRWFGEDPDCEEETEDVDVEAADEEELG